MRKANQPIIMKNYPLPTIDELIPRFRKAEWFIKLVIKNAFHHELSEECRYITTFISNTGLYRYKRLMFEMSCALENFQKIIERVLLSCKSVVNFIDDIEVFGNTEE